MYQLLERWSRLANDQQKFHTTIDVLPWLSKAMLDVIGLAGACYSCSICTHPTCFHSRKLLTLNNLGFGYHFDALAGENDGLADAYHLIFTSAQKLALRTILETWIPLIRVFASPCSFRVDSLDLQVAQRPHSDAMDRARAHLTRIGLQLIKERREAMIAETSTSDHHVELPKQNRPRDLLSVLGESIASMSMNEGVSPHYLSIANDNDVNVKIVQSNTATFASQRMTTPEVLCQISTFLVAGHETTSSALTWCLYALARNSSVQRRLRAALWTIPRDSPTLDEDVARLDYLDWVVRETLRIHAPVTWTMRVAMEGDNIPVEHPFLNRWGDVRNSIRVSKGDIITVPIQAINKSKQIWGEDAQLFRCVCLQRRLRLPFC